MVQLMAPTLGLPLIIHAHQTHRRWLLRRFTPCAHLESSSGTEQRRRSANYQPTIWQDNFIQSVNDRDQHDDKSKEKVYKLKRELSQMLYREEFTPKKLEFVDAIQQLGVAYHFKEEINSIMCECIDQISLTTMRGDLHEVSLLFRLLRMHGFSVHEELFKSYFDDNAHCKAKLSSNIRGMLSLYEASYLGKEGEEMLETARHFTTKHLTNFLKTSNSTNNYNSRLKEQVAHALDLPLHWRMERAHTRRFIDQHKNAEHIRPALWELASLEFNLVQNMYRRELKHVSTWWTNLGLYEKLPFARDRLVENYLWGVGSFFEPEHSSCRIAWTQIICLVTTIDDIFDVYGSLDELEVFTDAIEQWDIAVAERLPENMRMCISAVFKFVEDHGYEVMKKKGFNITPFLMRAWRAQCKAYLVEARWYHDGYKPTFEEYLDNAWVSIGGNILLLYAYCLNDHVTAENLEQFSSGYREIVRYLSTAFRLYNDLGTSSDEIKRGDTDKSVQCYMRDKNATESVARQEIKELIRKYWKLLNGEVTGNNSAFEKYFRTVCFSIPRMAQCAYQHGDGYGKSDGDTKDLITSLLFRPVS